MWHRSFNPLPQQEQTLNSVRKIPDSTQNLSKHGRLGETMLRPSSSKRSHLVQMPTAGEQTCNKHGGLRHSTLRPNKRSHLVLAPLTSKQNLNKYGSMCQSTLRPTRGTIECKRLQFNWQEDSQQAWQHEALNLSPQQRGYLNSNASE